MPGYLRGQTVLSRLQKPNSVTMPRSRTWKRVAPLPWQTTPWSTTAPRESYSGPWTSSCPPCTQLHRGRLLKRVPPSQAGGVHRGEPPLLGVWGCSPNSKSPQDWGIQRVDVDSLSNLRSPLLNFLMGNEKELAGENLPVPHHSGVYYPSFSLQAAVYFIPSLYSARFHHGSSGVVSSITWLSSACILSWAAPS